ncbi:3-deoxy-manno-octulosonate cytidylyltransferase [Caedimonas varicaedens]|uniref:3-deoxy-manno-octulosonate cytidylyltransferase n=1 Tax=Caedimonas varicaedens TaxID=1629334 RepID=A0A0K8MCK4_9PROT|nr:3-deoxy-manno-octulosonate cytidylyltransferase [Caedimonas varicaedens]
MNPIIIIPARMASTRLPGKPLANLAGKPMIVRVLERGLEADVGPVIVACDDLRVAEVVRDAGGKVCMTDSQLPSGSDRVYAALSSVDPEERYNIVINLQGDSPTTESALIRASLKGLKETDFDISTIAIKKENLEEIHNPNICKIALVGSENETVRRALYFSRSVIPAGGNVFYYHIGLYAYRRFALKKFVENPPSGLEIVERLEQLRALEIGLSIGVTLVNSVPQEVNTPEDLRVVGAYFESHSDVRQKTFSAL